MSAALRTDAATVPPNATIAELFDHHIAELRLRTVPVVDGAAFCGLVTIEDVAALPRSEWDGTHVADVMRTDVPTGDVQWTLRHAVGVTRRHLPDAAPLNKDLRLQQQVLLPRLALHVVHGVGVLDIGIESKNHYDPVQTRAQGAVWRRT